VNEVPSLLLVPIVLFAIATFAKGMRRANVAREVELAAVAAMVAVVLTILTTQGSLWSDPTSILHRLAPEKALRTIQFPSRLTAFLALALLVVVLSLERSAANVRSKRIGQTALGVAALWYVSLALVFVFSADRTADERSNEMSYGSIEAQSMPTSFASSQRMQFLLTERGVALDRPAEIATFDLDGHLDPATSIEPNSVVATNVVWSPLIRFSGAELLGRDEMGMAVIVARSSAPDAIAVMPRHPPVVLAGAFISLLGLGAAVWWLIADAGAGGRAWVGRRRVRPTVTRPKSTQATEG